MVLLASILGIAPGRAAAQRPLLDNSLAVAAGVGAPYGILGVAATTRAWDAPFTFTTGIGAAGVGLAVNMVFRAGQERDLRFIAAEVMARPWDDGGGILFRGAWSIVVGVQTDIRYGREFFLEYGLGIVHPFWEDESGWKLGPTLRFAAGMVL